MSAEKRIISNTDWFQGYHDKYSIKRIENADLTDTLSKARKYTADDIVIINSASRQLFYHCIAKILYPNVNYCL
ncbi:hypothetical protein, partial [Geobacter sp.]|uniref:hypothetical protein n=1 Tax=Geobacter sp. TaxID=46610 RepID=UPI002605063B